MGNWRSGGKLGVCVDSVMTNIRNLAVTRLFSRRVSEDRCQGYKRTII